MAAFREAVDALAKLGAEVVEVSCPHFEYALPAYYLIAPSECSSNLARFDGVRFGLRVGDDGNRSLEEVMSLTREAGFGPEVKRRIMHRHVRAVVGLLRRLLRAGAEGPHADHPGLHRRVRAGRRADLADHAVRGVPVRRRAPPTRTRCTWPTCSRSRPTCTAGRPSRCRADCPRGCRSGLQIMAPTMADDRMYRVAAALESASPLTPPSCSRGRRRGPPPARAGRQVDRAPREFRPADLSSGEPSW